ncbi:hypothetical protein SK128_008141 [Halocaridina rubra]|uniref:Uncharacterized protein n=1 Tax=Halocaridina rubra TaxID=373956 RepID=A0AAN9A8F1_HALRR
MTVPEFSDMIRNDPNNFYDNADDLLDGFRTIVYDTITPRMPELFLKVLVSELQIVGDPSPDGSGAFYLTGSYDGSRPGIFYVNTYHLDAQ